MDSKRLEALSDGVFAVAITLLIFDLKSPVPRGRGTLGHDLIVRWPHYLGYAISFVVIGMIWLNHHGIFRQIRQIDHPAFILNLLLLMFVVFIPYPTSVMAAYVRAGVDDSLATAFYGLILAATSLLLALLWVYAAEGHRMIDPAVPDDAVRNLTVRFLVAPVLYVAALLLAFWNVYAGLILYLAIAPLYFLKTRRKLAGIEA